MKLRNKRTTKK